MDLIIVESPTKAKTLSRFLGKGYEIEASYGHIRDLPQKKLGIDMKSNFLPEYVQTDKQIKRTEEIKRLSSKAKTIYLATDPDREGEAIAWHVGEVLGTKGKVLRRVTFHEITKKAIEEALKHPGDVDMKLVNAQQARRVLDRLVGYKLSPLLWRKIRKGLSAGRVQSVAVRLIVDKEREIEAFVPEEYWDIKVELQKLHSLPVEQLTVKLVSEEVKNGEDASRVENDLRVAEFVVVGVDKKKVTRLPLPPFTTSTLQQTAANKLGWSAKKTMQVAQNLYEEGLITYHRTDSVNIASEASAQCSALIVSQFGKEFALNTPRLFKTKSKSAQEAHEAIRPTDVGQIADRLSLIANKDQGRLYELIWKRFVACQMAESIGESVKVKIQAGRYGLEARGLTIKFEGWQKVYGVDKEEDEGVKLPELELQEKLDCVDVLKTQKFTQPPSRYNDASLIKALEEMGIGRPSTYAPTLSTIAERQYVEKVEKRFKPTALGIAVNDFLVTNFEKIVDYQFTAKMEEELDEIAGGEMEWQPVIAQFYEPFEKELDRVQEVSVRVKVEAELTGDKCPDCTSTGSVQVGDVVVRIGKFGRFLACSRYPECKYKANYQHKVGVKCPKCGTGEVIMKKTRNMKTFFGCSNYPQCEYASWNKPVVSATVSV